MNSAVQVAQHSDIEQAAEQVLQTITGLLAETRSSQQRPHLDSDLERDLGLDSLSRSELLLRLERSFQVRLPEHTLTATTPQELLQAVLAAVGDSTALPNPSEWRLDNDTLGEAVNAGAVNAGTVNAVPEQAQTLVDMLDWHVQVHPQHSALYLYQDDSQPQPINYAELQRGAREIATGLRARGLKPGQTVAIMLPTEPAYFTSFFGILLAGGTPVPIYPPARPNQIEDHLRRHARILANAACVMLITVPEAKLVARLLQAQVDSMRAIVTATELAQPVEHWIRQPVRSEDIAFLQYTSGSTGDPKGVILTHANLLDNIRALVRRVEAGAGDVFVSWLPLYHDMGLIGACLGSFYCGIPLAVMSPLKFLRRPASWLWAIHHHRGTISAAPNFAYELCLRNIHDADIEGLDLSSWRWALNGAEPVNPDTMRRFAERFAPYGFRAEALAPVYGLAECSVGLALPKPNRGLKVDCIERERFSKTGQAVPTSAASDARLEVVACGHVLNGHEMRIVDDNNQELPQRREGRLQFRGPSATQGYLNNPDATAKLFNNDWLESGDRGYIADADLYLTGRVKDMIIRGGRNIYPYELEQAIGAVDGVRKGCVAAFASENSDSGTEQLVIVAETREKDEQVLANLYETIAHRAVDILGAPADAIVLAPPHSVLKTSSGKIRRPAIRQLYEQNALGKSSHALWWQLVRVSANSVVAKLRSYARRLGSYLFAGYAWLVFGLSGLSAWAVVMILPNSSWRWRVCRKIVRIMLALTGTSLKIEGLENLPDKHQPCVVVANHSSYLDALVLSSAIPRDFCFIAKRELGKLVPLKWMLERLGTILIERFDMQQANADNERIVQTVRKGESVAFFPEGSFVRTPGLLPFRLGAFTVAAQTKTPVVPVILIGTRRMLLEDTWFPRPSSLKVIVGTAIQAQQDDADNTWQTAIKLRDQTRAIILEHNGEPDLSREDSPFYKSAKAN